MNSDFTLSHQPSLQLCTHYPPEATRTNDYSYAVDLKESERDDIHGCGCECGCCDLLCLWPLKLHVLTLILYHMGAKLADYCYTV